MSDTPRTDALVEWSCDEGCDIIGGGDRIDKVRQMEREVAARDALLLAVARSGSFHRLFKGMRELGLLK